MVPYVSARQQPERIGHIVIIELRTKQTLSTNLIGVDDLIFFCCVLLAPHENKRVTQHMLLYQLIINLVIS